MRLTVPITNWILFSFPFPPENEMLPNKINNVRIQVNRDVLYFRWKEKMYFPLKKKKKVCVGCGIKVERKQEAWNYSETNEHLPMTGSWNSGTAAWSTCQGLGQGWCFQAGSGSCAAHPDHAGRDVSESTTTAPPHSLWRAVKERSKAKLVLGGSGFGQGSAAKLWP